MKTAADATTPIAEAAVDATTTTGTTAAVGVASSNAALVRMAVCTCAGKQLHTRTSH